MEQKPNRENSFSSLYLLKLPNNYHLFFLSFFNSFLVLKLLFYLSEFFYKNSYLPLLSHFFFSYFQNTIQNFINFSFPTWCRINFQFPLIIPKIYINFSLIFNFQFKNARPCPQNSFSLKNSISLFRTLPFFYK